MPDRPYAIYGPLKIPRTKDRKRIAEKRIREFWEHAADGVAEACGCYIFGTQAGGGIRPWYVGQTRRTFREECFTDGKLRRYDSVISNRAGTPILLLLARMTPTTRNFGTPTPTEADWVEQMLIQHCLYANNDLLNVHGARLVREVVIPGLHNNPVGYPTDEVRALRQLLSLK